MAHRPGTTFNSLPRRGREKDVSRLQGTGLGFLSVASSMSSSRSTSTGHVRNQPWVAASQWSSGLQERTVATGAKGLTLNEKEVLQDVNCRFSAFIDTVHQLEIENENLEVEILQLKQTQASCLEFTKPLQLEVEGLRELIREIGLQKASEELKSCSLEKDIQVMWSKGEQEAKVREETEFAIRGLEDEISQAHRAKAELHKKVQYFLDEIEAMKKSHQEDLAALRFDLHSTEVSVEKKQSKDLASSLRDIRALLQSHPTSDLVKTEQWFQSRADKLSQVDQSNTETLRAARQELNQHARQLQSKNAELDMVLETRARLERQLMELEEQHNAETSHLQNVLVQLENELKMAKWEVAGHLQEYEDLLRVKGALDTEISSYRKLLEHEERRIASVSGQSPIRLAVKRDTPPRFHPVRISPQYKFVEEIITETTEMEMSEAGDTEEDVMSVEELEDLCSPDKGTWLKEQEGPSETVTSAERIMEEQDEKVDPHIQAKHHMTRAEATNEKMREKKKPVPIEEISYRGVEDNMLKVDEQREDRGLSQNIDAPLTSMALNIHEEMVPTKLAPIQTQPQDLLVQKTIEMTHGSETEASEGSGGALLLEEGEDYCHQEKTRPLAKQLEDSEAEKTNTQEKMTEEEPGIKEADAQRKAKVREVITGDTEAKIGEDAEKKEDMEDTSKEESRLLEEDGSLKEGREQGDNASTDPGCMLLPLTTCILQKMATTEQTQITIQPQDTFAEETSTITTRVAEMAEPRANEGGEVPESVTKQHHPVKEDRVIEDSQEEPETETATPEKEKQAEQQGDTMDTANHVNHEAEDPRAISGEMKDEVSGVAGIKEEMVYVTKKEATHGGAKHTSLELGQESSFVKEFITPTVATEEDERITKQEDDPEDLTLELTTISPRETTENHQKQPRGGGVEASMSQEWSGETEEPEKLMTTKQKERGDHPNKADGTSEVVIERAGSLGSALEGEAGETIEKQEIQSQSGVEVQENDGDSLHTAEKHVCSEKESGASSKTLGTMQEISKEGIEMASNETMETRTIEEKMRPESSSNGKILDGHFTEVVMRTPSLVEDEDNRTERIITEHISASEAQTAGSNDFTKQDQQEEVSHDSPTQAQEEDVSHDSPTQAQEEEVSHDSPMPTQEDEVTHDAPTQAQEEDVSHDSPRQAQKEDVSEDCPTQAEEEVSHDSPTQAQEEEVSNDSPMQTQEDKVTQDAPTQAQEEEVYNDLPTQAQEEEVSKDSPTQAQEEEVPHDSPIQTEEEEVAYYSLMQAQEEEVSDDSPTQEVSDDSPTQAQEEEVSQDSPMQAQEVEVSHDSPTQAQEEEMSHDTPTKEVSHDSHTKAQEEEVSQDCPTQVQKEDVSHDSPTQAQAEEVFQDSTTQAQEKEASHGSPTQAQEEEVSHDSPTQAQEEGISHDSPTQAQEKEASHDSPTHAQEKEVSHDSPTQAQEEQVPHESPTQAQEEDVSHDSPTHAQEEEVSHDSPTQAQEEQVPHESPTQAQEEQVPHESPTQAQEEQVPHESPTQAQEEDVSHDSPTQAQEEQVPHESPTQAQEEDVSHDSPTHAQEEEVSHDSPTQAQEEQVLHESPTQAQEEDASHDSPTHPQEEEVSHDSPAQAQEEQVTHDLSTASQKEEASHDSPRQAQGEQVTHDLSTQAQEEMFHDSPTQVQEEQATYDLSTQVQKEEGSHEFPLQAEEEQETHDLSTQAQEEQEPRDLSTQTQEEKVTSNLSSQDLDEQVIHDVSSQDQKEERSHDYPTQAQEEQATHDLSTSAQVEQVTHDLSTHDQEAHVTHDLFAQDQKEQVAHDLSTPAQEEQVARDLSTASQEEQVGHDVSAPAQKEQVAQYASTQDQEEQVSLDVSMQVQAEQVTHGSSTQAQKEDGFRDSPTQPQKEEVSHDSPTQDQEEQVTHDLSTHYHEKQRSHDLPTQIQEEQGSHAIPPQVREEEGSLKTNSLKDESRGGVVLSITGISKEKHDMQEVKEKGSMAGKGETSNDPGVGSTPEGSPKENAEDTTQLEDGSKSPLPMETQQ